MKLGESLYRHSAMDYEVQQGALFASSSLREEAEETNSSRRVSSPLSNSLEETVEIAKSCTKCPLCETRRNVVVHDGNPEAQLMVIGEGPGEHEDLQSTPFVGKAGQLLDKILASVDLDRQRDTYICNVVKCRPPSNRKPLPSEIAACLPYLHSQIYHVNPRIILLLGATAVAGVLGYKDPKITKLHGTWLQDESPLLQNIDIMPFYHPAYLLRNQSRDVGSPKWQAWQAIQEVRRKLSD